MEDVKPTISLQSDENGAIETRFVDLCKNGLGLDESMMRQAMVFFKESKHIMLANMSAIGSGSPEEVEGFWSAFVVYCATRLSRGKANKESDENGVPLCHILRAFKLNVVDFFKEMPQLSLKAGYILSGLYGSDWEKRLKLKELQANFVHLSLLSRYYRRAYQEFFLTETGSAQHSAVSISTGYVSDYHRFGWLLFLALRVHVFSRFKDLVTCTNGLVSILAILILHVPVRLRKFKIQDSKLFVKKSDIGINLLASLCNIYQTSEDELRSTMEEVNNLITTILKKQPSSASECKRENLDYIITDGLMYFEDLLEEKSLQSSLNSLEKDYEGAMHDRGELELDERMFIDENESVLGTGSLSGGAINMCSRKQTSIAIASPTKMPLRLPTSPLNGNHGGNSMMSISTPVSTAMTTAKWLRDVILPLPSKPTAELRRFLSSCDKDLTADVTRRANIILGAIFPSNTFERSMAGNLQSTNLMDTIWAEQRKMEAMKLYYRVLEAMCRAESHILNCKNLTSLLTNERFHRCMLACSAELVLATHKTVTMMFPAVLEKTGITAFDLSKVIESFVRHEETLPRELKRHLNSLEERLLESMAWEKCSSMYNSLIVARPTLSAEINRLGLLAEPMPSLDVMEAHYNISSAGLPPPPTRKREAMPDQNGDPQTPKRNCSESRSVLIERNSFTSPVRNSFTSPVKEYLLSPRGLRLKLPHLQSAFASPTRPNPAVEGETCAESGIKIFFSKIVKLAAIRIRSLCERLQLSQQSLERIYCLIQRILSQRTTLFFNRHVDQLILCSFYGVAKISQLSLTFKEIIYHYRKQPQCKSQVFRSVFVCWPSTSRNGKVGQDHIDIITFYNEIFIPSVKPLLVELASNAVTQEEKSIEDDNNNADCQIPVSPQFSPFPNLPDMSPRKVSASHNVYVSPLRSSKMDTLLSPSSKSYYACVGESTHAFQSPSKDLTAINNRLNGGRKVNSKLNFDLVSDSVVAESLDLQNGASSPASAPCKASVKSEKPDT